MKKNSIYKIPKIEIDPHPLKDVYILLEDYTDNYVKGQDLRNSEPTKITINPKILNEVAITFELLNHFGFKNDKIGEFVRESFKISCLTKDYPENGYLASMNFSTLTCNLKTINCFRDFLLKNNLETEESFYNEFKIFIK